MMNCRLGNSDENGLKNHLKMLRNEEVMAVGVKEGRAVQEPGFAGFGRASQRPKRAPRRPNILPKQIWFVSGRVGWAGYGPG